MVRAVCSVLSYSIKDLSVQEVVKFTSSNHMQFNLLASPDYFISAGGQNIHQNIVK